MDTTPPHVGTLTEGALHAALKRRYAGADGRVEQLVDGFVVDVVLGDELIEVQTGGFSSMRRKLTALVGAGHHVRLVHPVAVERILVKVDGDGVVTRRRSPRRGSVVDVFAELVAFPALLADPHLVLEVVLVRDEEHRRWDPANASWRRRGWVSEGRHLVEVVDTVVLDQPDDLLALLPGDLPVPFTTADLAAALGRPRRLAQQTAYCLREAGLLDVVGKDGNALAYAPAGSGQ